MMAMTTHLIHGLDPLVLLPPPFSLPRRLLRLQASTTEAASSPADPTAVNSNAFLILVALLCALICVVGLALVARCAWLRRAVVAATTPRPKAPTNKGLKKKAIRALPKLAFSPAHRATLPFSDCPICLADFAEGDQVRVLPRCAHAFHAPCIDTWLAAHSSCPSCRRNLADAASGVPKGTARLQQPAQAGAASGTTVSVPSVATSTCAGKFEGCGEASRTVKVDGKEQGPKVLVID